jgi:hypothetical protein
VAPNHSGADDCDRAEHARSRPRRQPRQRSCGGCPVILAGWRRMAEVVLGCAGWVSMRRCSRHHRRRDRLPLRLGIASRSPGWPAWRWQPGKACSSAVFSLRTGRKPSTPGARQTGTVTGATGGFRTSSRSTAPAKSARSSGLEQGASSRSPLSCEDQGARIGRARGSCASRGEQDQCSVERT